MVGDNGEVVEERKTRHGRRSTDMDVCPYHGDLMEKLGQLRANQDNLQRSVDDLKADLNRAVECMEKATDTLNKEQTLRVIGKVVIWAGTVTGAYLLVEYIRGCFK